MNKSYRIVWNRVRNCLMVVSETTKSQGKAGATKAAVVGAVAAAVMAIGAADALACTSPITGAQAGPCVLSTGESLTVDTNGTISGASTGIAVYNAVAGTVVNNGTVTGAYYGVLLTSSASLNGITNSGSVHSGYATVLVRGDSTVGGINNLSTGIISSNQYGIYLSGAHVLNGIQNAGLITVSANTNPAVWLNNSTVSGGFTNSGTISGPKGLYISMGAVTGGFTNSGLLTSTGTSQNGFSALKIDGANVSGGVANLSGSTISGGGYAVSLTNGAILNGNLFNAGLIEGNYPIYLNGNSSSLVEINGSIINTTGGTIRATGTRDALLISYVTMSGGITNSGSVIGSSGFSGIGITKTTMSGGINNLSGGTISGGFAGLLLKNGLISSGINNAGLLRQQGAGGSAVVFVRSGGKITGGIANTGTIEGEASGIVMERSTVSGGVNNSSLMTVGGTAVYLRQNSVLNDGFFNDVAGQIIGGAVLGLSCSTVVGGVTNAGLMSVSGTAISLAAGSSLTGNIINTVGGVINAVYGGLSASASKVVGDIVNYGQISVSSGYYGGGYGIFIGEPYPGGGGSTLTGSIQNLTSGTTSGTISAAGNAAIKLSNSTISGGLFNSGLIVTSDIYNAYGSIHITGSNVAGSIVNNVGGSILGGISAGLYISGGSSVGGGITNSGFISPGGSASNVAGINVSGSTVSGGITNSGIITATGYGIALIRAELNNGGIYNAPNGTIAGNLAGIYLNAYSGGSASQLAGGIVNAGLITGGANGINVGGGTITGSIVNSASGRILGDYGINVSSNGAVNNGVTNAGLIYGTSAAIQAASVGVVGVSNQAGGSIVGAILGNLNVTNSGLLALQTISGSTIAGGSHVNGSILGNYVQNASAATLAIGVSGLSGTGTIAGNYSQLSAGGIASLTAGTISVSMDNASAVSAGGTLAGVVTSTSNQLTASGLTIADNSALVNFIYSTTAGSLSLIAEANITGCGATVTGGRTGPCEVAFDAQNIYVAAAGSIGGAATGIKVLTGAITAGGIINAGTVLGSIDGVKFLAGTTFTGNLSNTGLISGSTAGVLVAGTVIGSIINTTNKTIAGAVGVQLAAGARLVGGVSNTGYISSIDNAGRITSSGTAIYIGGVGALVSGGITNSGSITAVNDAIRVYNYSTVNGGITNTGLLASTKSSPGQVAAIYTTNSVVNGGIANIGGTITALGVYASGGVAIYGGKLNGGLTNTGVISNGGNGAIRVYGATWSGGINNSGTISNSAGAKGIIITRGTFAGGITNSGLISSNAPAIYIKSNATVSGGISNAGLISGNTGGVAVSAEGSANRVNFINSPLGTVIGAVNGNVNVTNSGLYLLQTTNSFGGAIVPGAYASASMLGDYSQTSGATLGIGVTGTSGSGTIAGNYSQLTVGGIASLTASTINISMNNDTAVVSGGTLAGVVTSGSNQLTATGLAITDNSAQVDFIYTTTAGALNLVAVHNTSVCSSPVTGSQQGPCEVAFDNQTITVAGTGSIGGAATGIKVQTGAITAGGILNAGTVLGSSYGVNVLAGGTFTGNISNTGLISGATAGVVVAGVLDQQHGIVNAAGGSIGGGVNGIQLVAGATIGGIINSGSITGSSGAGIAVQSGGSILNAAGLGVWNQGGSIDKITNAGLIMGMYGGIGANANSQITSGIANSGTIVSVLGYGVVVSGATVSGGINNSGSIGNGIGMTNALVRGGLTNSGSITGLVTVDGSSTLSGGVVNAAGYMNGVSNSGLITASGAAIAVNGGVFDSVTNVGTIRGGSASVAIAVDATLGGLNNQGFINSVNNAGTLSALVNTGTIGGLTSTGSIGSINNNAAIITATGYGIAVNGGQVDSITTSGFIGGGTGAISVAGSATLNNILIAGNNTASFGGLVDAVNTAVTVAGGATYTLNSNFNVSNFTNEGVVIATANPTVSGSLSNAANATVIGAINGLTNISNNGLIALQTMSGGTIVGGSHVNASISGNYVQNAATAALSIGTSGTAGTGTLSGNYSQMAVGGIASLTAGTINVSMNNDTAVVGGGTLAGVVTSGSNQLTATGLAITDNSAQVDFIYTTTAGALDLVAVANSNVCGATISGSQQGPCEVAFDKQSINVAATGSIGGAATGIKVLTGAIAAGSIVNAGTVLGSVNAVNFLAGGTFTGNVNNSGLIQGATGVLVNSTINGAIINSAGGSIVGTAGAGVLVAGNALISNGIQNSGYISSINNAGVVSALTNSGKINSLTNSGSLSGLNNSATLTALNNNGTISTVVNSGGLNSLTNTGSISSLSNSANLGAVNNSGTVNALVNSGTVIGVVSTGNIGSISNTAIITATGYGIAVNGGQIDSITTSGLIGGGTGAISVAGSATLNSIIITGNNTASFGGAVIAANTPVTVAGGATYTLNSNFEVSNFNNQGTLIAPVASVAAPTITGNLTLGNTGTLAPTVASQTSYTQITVSGNASIAGALAVNAAAVTSIIAGSTLAGVITARSVSGTFGSYTDNSVLYDFMPVYNGTMVGLAVVQNSSGTTYTSIAQSTGNLAALGVAGALQQISTMTGVMTPVTTAFGQMTSDQQISNAMSQTLPVMSGATTWNTMSVLSSINRIIEARHLQNKGISSGDDFYGNHAVWMKPFGSWTNQANQNGAYGFKANTGGLMLGGDTIVEKDTRLGFAAAWGNTSAQSNAGVAPQTQSSNLYQFIGYGSYALTNSLEANFQANGGWNNNTSNRSIGFMGTSAQGSYSSTVWHVGAGLSNPFQVAESTQLIPSARFDYSWMRNSSYNETGASNGLGLNVAAQTYQMSILSADGKVVHKLNDHNSVNANLGVGYNFSPTQTNVAAAFQGAPTLQFTTNGINPSAVMGHAGVGYTYKVKDGIDLGVRYDLDFQNTYTNQTATAKARWTF